MRVIYEPPIADRFRQIRREALQECRTIHMVYLSFTEARELQSWLQTISLYAPVSAVGTAQGEFLGIKWELDKEEKAD